MWKGSDNSRMYFLNTEKTRLCDLLMLWVGIPAPPETWRLRGVLGSLGCWVQRILPLIQLMCYWLAMPLKKTLVLLLLFLYCLSFGRKAVYLSPPFNVGHRFLPWYQRLSIYISHFTVWQWVFEIIYFYPLASEFQRIIHLAEQFILPIYSFLFWGSSAELMIFNQISRPLIIIRVRLMNYVHFPITSHLPGIGEWIRDDSRISRAFQDDLQHLKENLQFVLWLNTFLGKP